MFVGDVPMTVSGVAFCFVFLLWAPMRLFIQSGNDIIAIMGTNALVRAMLFVKKNIKYNV